MNDTHWKVIYARVCAVLRRLMKWVIRVWIRYSCFTAKEDGEEVFFIPLMPIFVVIGLIFYAAMFALGTIWFLFLGVIAFFTRAHPLFVWGSVLLIVLLSILIIYLKRRGKQ